MSVDHILHVYNTPGGRTLCGRKFLKLVPGISLANIRDILGPKPVQGHETLCPKCADTDEYRERYALWLLGNV